MKKILQIASRLETFQNTIFQTVAQTIKANEEIVIEMNSEDQLFEQGVDRNNEALAGRQPYSPVTISIKRMKGQPTSRVTLRDTEGFHRSFYIKYSGDGFALMASDWKAGDLIDKYGPIMGLTDANLTDLLRNYILPDLIKEARTCLK